MKILFGFLFFLYCVGSDINAQIPDKGRSFSVDLYTTENVNIENILGLKFDYAIKPKYSIGAYVGFNNYARVHKQGYQLSGHQIMFGFNNKYYLKNIDVLFRPYFSGQIGYATGKSSMIPYYRDQARNDINYGVYIGGQLGLYKSLKMFLELGYGNDHITNFGLAYCL